MLKLNHARPLLALGLLLAVLPAVAQTAGTYRNPVLFSDYSDPDAIRDGNLFYLVASTFSYSPGLPILESPDLVHWTIIGHVLQRLELGPPYDLDGGNRYGGGVWAPALRRHNGLFYVYFPTPDEGIFVSTAPSMRGPWSKPVTVIAGPGLEDPCPLWDDDGKAYLVHSRKGAGPLILHRMAPDGLSVLDDGKEIVRDPVHLHALEGPKFYKRGGWYYLFAPFGGVGTGAQTVLRSRTVDGPYEHRTVLAQGTTAVNGPHQGAYVETPDGTGWFLHFQQRGGHGRILWLEPVRWQDDWPIIGEAPAGAVTGQPVLTGPLPAITHPPAIQRPQTSDEFSTPTLGPQWEWNHNPDDTHWSLTQRPGWLRLTPAPAQDLFTARNTLTQSMQDESFTYTAELDLQALAPGSHIGLAMFEKAASGLDITTAADGSRTLSFFHQAEHLAGPALQTRLIALRLEVHGQSVSYFYSLDRGSHFLPLGPPTPIAFSWWKGSRPALFAYTTAATGKAGHVDIAWVHYEPLDLSTP